VHNSKDLKDSYLGSGIALNRAIRKYGKEQFIRETLQIFQTADEAYKHEAAIVTQDEVKNQQCYNMRVGGKGGFDYINSIPNRLNAMKNPESRNKCIEAARITRAKNPEKYKSIAIDNAKKGAISNIGKKRSLETRSKMSAGSKGHVCSEYTKEAVRQSRLGVKDNNETRLKKSEARKQIIREKHIDMGIFTRGKKRSKPNAKMKRTVCLCGRQIGANWIRRHEKQCKTLQS
jgi:hypothetical protein